MIEVTKLNGKKLIVNAELIEFMEATPDTTITMNTGRKVIAKESLDEIIDKVLLYKKKIYQTAAF